MPSMYSFAHFVSGIWYNFLNEDKFKMIDGKVSAKKFVIRRKL